MTKKESLIISVAIVLIFLLGCTIFFMFKKMRKTEQDMHEMVEQFNYEKEALADEYSDLSFIEGFEGKIKNDSILRLLANEKQRVQLLLEELRQTKATNVQRIAELKKELASVRKVMISYINQIDSLNRVNTHLVSENREIRTKYTEATQAVESLGAQNEQLSQQVKLASMLEARDIVVLPLNSREKKTKRLRKIALLKIDFTILKNHTTPTGMKEVFVRITLPDERVLQKSTENVFLYEERQIAFSCKKQFEYSGEEIHQTLYWQVEEILIEGKYRVEIFVDGALIGHSTFSLD